MQNLFFYKINSSLRNVQLQHIKCYVDKYGIYKTMYHYGTNCTQHTKMNVFKSKSEFYKFLQNMKERFLHNNFIEVDSLGALVKVINNFDYGLYNHKSIIKNNKIHTLFELKESYQLSANYERAPYSLIMHSNSIDYKIPIDFYSLTTFVSIVDMNNFEFSRVFAQYRQKYIDFWEKDEKANEPESIVLFAWPLYEKLEGKFLVIFSFSGQQLVPTPQFLLDSKINHIDESFVEPGDCTPLISFQQTYGRDNAEVLKEAFYQIRHNRLCEYLKIKKEKEQIINNLNDKNAGIKSVIKL